MIRKGKAVEKMVLAWRVTKLLRVSFAVKTYLVRRAARICSASRRMGLASGWRVVGVAEILTADSMRNDIIRSAHPA